MISFDIPYFIDADYPLTDVNILTREMIWIGVYNSQHQMMLCY